MTKYAYLGQFLIILADNVGDLSDELLRLQNILGFIRARSSYHLMYDRNSFSDMMIRLVNLYGRDKIPSISFREYFDIIKVGYYYNIGSLVLVFKFPIIHPITYKLFKLSVVPNEDNKILIPSYPFLAIHDKEFMYIEAECPKSSIGYLCENKLSHHYESQADCVYRLVTTQKIDESCHFTSVTLQMGAVEQLDDRHYVISFPKPTKVHVSCKEDLYSTIKGSYLATLPKGCLLQTPEFTIINNEDHIKGQALKIINLPAGYLPEDTPEKKIKLHSIDLQHLHNTNTEIYMESPVTIGDAEERSLYYTIIPLYLLMFGATVLGIWLVARRCIQKRKRVLIATATETSIELNEARTPGQPAQPGLSALFSNPARQ